MKTGHDFENPEASPHSSALKLLTLALTVGVVFATETASAQLVNVNFDAGVTQTEGSLFGPAGGMATSWNQYAGAIQQTLQRPPARASTGTGMLKPSSSSASRWATIWWIC
jgi:hypothetical protein